MTMKRTPRKPTSTVSKAQSYEEIGEYWDSHDLGVARAGGKPAAFSVDIKRRRFLVAIEPALFAKVRRQAAKKGVSAESLLNLWVQEKCAASH